MGPSRNGEEGENIVHISDKIIHQKKKKKK